MDATHSDFNDATGASAGALRWAQGDLPLNSQPDGSAKDSGAITAYVHNFTIPSW
jgi:hypothetical protein